MMAYLVPCWIAPLRVEDANVVCARNPSGVVTTNNVVVAVGADACRDINGCDVRQNFTVLHDFSWACFYQERAIDINEMCLKSLSQARIMINEQKHSGCTVIQRLILFRI
jgi:hypothetical protein